MRGHAASFSLQSLYLPDAEITTVTLISTRKPAAQNPQKMETAAAILQVAEMAGKTAFQIHEAISIIRDAPREIQTINRDVHSFYILVHNLSESLSSDLVSNIVNEDTEISNALWTLNDPILNCCAALDRLMKKIKPHLKTDESLPSSQPEYESSETVRRTHISRSDIMWHFRRKGVYNLANDLERTKSTREAQFHAGLPKTGRWPQRSPA